MKKILGIVFLSFFLSTSVHSDNIKNFKIENISIGDSALDYFNETELENGELKVVSQLEYQIMELRIFINSLMSYILKGNEKNFRDCVSEFVFKYKRSYR